MLGCRALSLWPVGKVGILGGGSDARPSEQQASGATGAHDEGMIEAKGHNGQVQFDGEYVTITRKGFLARSSVGKGEKRIHVSQIAAVQWKPPGALMNGFIQFTVPGGAERRSQFGSQTSSAVNDENTVLVTKKQAPQFEELRAAVDEAIARSHAAAPSPQASLADELAKLQQLADDGVISPEDLAAAKAKLLGQ